ncbi:MAG: OmpA family protein [Cyclobacteriaceae bacterium]
MKRLITSYLFILLFSFFAMAQTQPNANGLYREAIKALNVGDSKGAIEKFQAAIKVKNDYKDAWYYLGMTYAREEMHNEAIFAFRNLEKISPDYNSSFYYEIIKAYIATDQLTNAGFYAKKYLAKIPKTPKNTRIEHRAKNRLIYASESVILREQPNTTSEPEPVDAVNSISGDYMPQVNPTGTRLYFTSVRQGGFDFRNENSKPNDYGEDIYFSNLKNDVWSTPQLLPAPLNSTGNDFGSAFTGDGQMMVYVKCSETKGVGSCDLYITELNGTTWTEPVNMGNVVNSEDWESQPTISSDGNRIIFASTRSGGYGGADLYMSEKNHLGDWGIPQNLGSTINTPLSDGSPYLAPDGKTLYYSTAGHPGFGGNDIFYSVFENNKWSKPENLGKPINSEGDDTNFSISASGFGYMASSRRDENNFDLYKVELPDHLKPKPTAVVQGIVSNAESSEPLEALVLVEDLETGELLAVNKSNSESGEYLVVLPAGRNYSVSASSEGYFFYSQSFELPKDTTYQEITKDINLEPIKKGTKVVLNNIFFETGRAELKPISYVELNKAVKLLEENPSMIIEIGGHTDSQGSDANNLALSTRRAEAVVNYMVLAGLDKSRLQAKGYGETQPIADNTTKEGRAANRRTEFEIVGF